MPFNSRVGPPPATHGVQAALPATTTAQGRPSLLTTRSASTVITCLSKQGERLVYKADTAAGVALLRSTGDSSCLLGKTWGYDGRPLGVGWPERLDESRSERD
jgi:hypothetical protein